ncbi:MAG: efflux RND transporter periplasmic adaptor subunit [bacterium]|nr:efflux RND transporter periplasmic adaptor subunit [bacterium]
MKLIKKTTYKSSYITCIIISLLVITSGCNTKPTKEENKTEVIQTQVTLTDAQFKNAGIVLGKIEQKQVSSTLKVNGKIDVPPQNMVSISVPLGGYLKSTNLLPGMHVNKGEIIATIEDQQYIQLQQDLLIAKAQFSSIESEYQRQLELNKTKTTSDKIFEQTKANYLTQKITIKSLTEKLKLIGINPDNLNENSISKSINIYSPINGFTSKVNANIGKYINPSEVLFELVNPSDIHLNLNVYEKDINKLFIGQKLVAFNNVHPEIQHKCQVLLISKDLNQNGSTEVHCHFDDYDKSLIPGMYMNAEIEIKNNIASVLPENAVVRFEGKQFIFEVLGDKQFNMLEIEVGNIENGWIEIITVISPSKQIVTEGAYNLLMTLKNKAEE